ncbi:MAG: sulfite exporter TauE/SafE family protein [Mariprofundaceae bacterium]
MGHRLQPIRIIMNASQHKILFFLITAYAIMAAATFFQLNGINWLLQECSNYWHFFIIGLGGAVIATGAGGGIVFIPAFTNMGLSQEQAVGTSIVIQCFGMTTGAIAWFLSFRKRPAIYQRYESFMKITILVAGISSIIGVLIGEYILSHKLPFSVNSAFSMLSICFGLIILTVSYIKSNNSSPRSQASKLDLLLCSLIGLAGGVITSIISIGVGEILLMLLFFRRYPIQIAIFMAVAISAITVLAAAPSFIWGLNSVVWGIVMFAAPAAMLGGVLGQKLTAQLGATRIKIFCALWILFTGIIA